MFLFSFLFVEFLYFLGSPQHFQVCRTLYESPSDLVLYLSIISLILVNGLFCRILPANVYITSNLVFSGFAILELVFERRTPFASHIT